MSKEEIEDIIDRISVQLCPELTQDLFRIIVYYEKALQKLNRYEEILKGDRLTGQEENGKYYTVEEKILIANEQVNPTRTWIVHNENRRYGSPMDKLGKLEDIYRERE